MHPADRDNTMIRHRAIAAEAPTAAPIPTEWREVIDFWLGVNPDAARMWLTAYTHGLRLDDLRHVTFEGPKLATGGYPFAFFDVEDGEYATVHPEDVWIYRSEGRDYGAARS
jgi:hypothetical protein